jgi:polyisoprenoid-binding protein YceI
VSCRDRCEPEPTSLSEVPKFPLEGDDLYLDGDLTLKDVTKHVPLKLEVNGFGPDVYLEDPASGARVGFTATGEINRMDFNVTFNSPIPGGGVALSEKIQLVLEIEGALKSRS